MSFPLLPVVSSPTEIDAVSVVGQVLTTVQSIDKYFLNDFPAHVDVFVDLRASPVDPIDVLNAGVKQIVVDKAKFDELTSSGIPEWRLVLANSASFPKEAAILVTKPLSDDDFNRLSDDGNRPIYLEKSFTEEEAIDSAKKGYIPVIPARNLAKSKAANSISIGEIFTSTLTTDRSDGLFTTLVVAPPPTNSALGVVYSSVASIHAAIADGEGVYQSRKRRDELWYKGKTSGATQKLLRLEKDCDSDAIKFVVETKSGYGFCHLNKNFTCYKDGQLAGDACGSGLAKLDSTLTSRKRSAPEGSYTKRLFEDDKLLIAKLKEELDELIEAGQKKNSAEVAFECADLFYFALTWCVKHNVSLADVERNLDIKSLKVTRRKGDAKPAYLEKNEKTEKKPEEQTEIPALYKMEAVKIDDVEADTDKLAKTLARPVQKTADIMKLVLPIIENVQKNGDKALLELTAKFDGVLLDTPVLRAPFPAEAMNISDDMKEAIDLSMSNIEKFHAAQLPKEKIMTVETSPGVFCSRFAKPIENVGLYVPGGTAVLPSTAMMLGVPAKVAGCSNIIIASPPARETGKLTPEVVYVAHKLGASAILMAGGAQAVTAMAYGTESVVKCDKILGPGNQFVTAAKMYVQNDTQALCSIDMPAGPSEVLVIADKHADADFVASDLLSQAEHGVDSQVILIGVDLSSAKLAEFEEAVKRHAEVLPRKDIVAKCLAHSYILLVDSYDKAFDLSNKYAPEHLILQIEKAESFVPDKIENAGSVFVGALSPESCGDYSSGTNHTLPTYGYARQYSGVNTATFQKFITSQQVTEQGLKSIGKAVMTLAAVEGLEAHRNAIQVRMDKLGL
ncbi:Histidine biosynthesis trifunctional protein [Meyerozyma sp. JA9]|nr:Histidine biosynthesis trifunctional protein [Meyerozyma sp. JA9]